MIDTTQWLFRRLHVVRKRYCMMIENPLQTSLPSKPLEMFIGWQTYWILLTNQAQNQDLHIFKQCGWSDALQVCGHSFKSRLLSWNTLKLSFLRSLIRNRFGFNFHATRRQKKRTVRESTSSLPLLLSPFNYGYSFRRKRTHCIGMESQTEFERVENTRSP